ncbi:hypothetical protein EV667_0355 [Ancylobacter aquaticus]|uniref:Uncharacterized protein n=1 Tax=Ancylobacter aquaticus TaxID=100 RepID=A0A4R1I4P5_ANCAQ|nr:hypothetical protein [Ancylobacter aquaticus]TCK30267.1 hypothetical protein EV667_0355 [Ancylobacter aquaticus]
MATDHEPTTGRDAPASSPPLEGAELRRRAALAKLGRVAAYSVPATVGLMMMSRSARAS